MIRNPPRWALSLFAPDENTILRTGSVNDFNGGEPGVDEHLLRPLHPPYRPQSGASLGEGYGQAEQGADAVVNWRERITYIVLYIARKLEVHHQEDARWR